MPRQYQTFCQNGHDYPDPPRRDSRGRRICEICEASRGAAKFGTYDLTEMRSGGYRAECLIEGCWWWHDYEDPEVAASALRQHMRAIHQRRITLVIDEKKKVEHA